MASRRVQQILRSRRAPFTEDELYEITDAVGWQWIYADSAKDRIRPRREDDDRGDGRPEVCLTGFGAEEANALAAFADENGYCIVTSVTKHLRYLVMGPTPGPVKVEKAVAQGAVVMTAQRFHDHCVDQQGPLGGNFVRQKLGGFTPREIAAREHRPIEVPPEHKSEPISTFEDAAALLRKLGVEPPSKATAEAITQRISLGLKRGEPLPSQTPPPPEPKRFTHIKLKCPAGHLRRVGLEWAGANVSCLECGHVWRVPAAPGATGAST